MFARMPNILIVYVRDTDDGDGDDDELGDAAFPDLDLIHLFPDFRKVTYSSDQFNLS